MSRIAQRTNHIRRAPGCRQPHHHVGRGQIQCDKIGFTQRRIILRAFYRFEQRTWTAGNQPDDHAVRHAEGWWAFRGIQHAKAAAGPGTEINQPTAGLQCRRRQVHCLCDSRQHLFYRLRHLAVFLIEATHHFQRCHLVESKRGRVAAFGY
ncbi:hypothetical protein D3C72_1491570 [compost metagenome]